MKRLRKPENPELEGEQAAKAEEPPQPPGVVVFEYLETLIIAAAIVVILCTFVFRMVRVDGISMVPTLSDGDLLVSTHALYTPEKGDIVVITQPNDVAVPLIKRVVATGGDTIDIDFERGRVYVNGGELDEDYINEPTRYRPDACMEFPLTVPEGMIFAMGDNRNHSSDSRDARVGLVDARYIMGRTFFRVFPFQRIGVIGQ